MAVSSTSRYPLVIEPLAGKFPIKYGSFIAGKIIENHGECSIATFDEQMVFLGSYGGGQQFQHSAKIMRKIHFLVLKILMKIQLPSGKRPNITMERSTMLLMGKSTFSMAMFNSFLYVHQRASHLCRSASEHPFLDRKKTSFRVGSLRCAELGAYAILVGLIEHPNAQAMRSMCGKFPAPV